MKVLKAYEPLFNKPKGIRYILVRGGRGSGKSVALSQFVVKKLFNNTYARGVFMRQTYGTLEDSIFAEICDRISDLSNKHQKKIFVKKQPLGFQHKNGNKFTGKSFQTSTKQNTAKLKSLAGVNYVIIDEAEEIELEAFTKLVDSLRKVDVDITIVLAFNPPHANHWINEKWYNLIPTDENTQFLQATLKPEFKDTVIDINTTYYDNIVHIHEQTAREYESYKTSDPEHYYHMIRGLTPRVKTRLIFPDYSQITFETYKNVPSLELYGMDFGSNDPTTLVGVKINNENRTLYIHEYFYQQRSTLFDISDAINEYANNSVVYADAQSKQMIESLQSMGLNIVQSKKGSGSVLAGIKKISSYSIVVTNTSSNIIDELNNYCWKKGNDKRATDVPEDKYNHAIDAVRYAIAEEPASFTRYEPIRLTTNYFKNKRYLWV